MPGKFSHHPQWSGPETSENPNGPARSMTFGQSIISHHLLCSKNYTNQWYPLNIHVVHAKNGWTSTGWLQIMTNEKWLENSTKNPIRTKCLENIGKYHICFKGNYNWIAGFKDGSSWWKRTNCNSSFSDGCLGYHRPNSDPKPRRSKNSTSMVIKRRPSAAWLELSCPRWIHFANPTIETTPYPEYAIHWVSGYGFFKWFPEIL